MEIIRSIKKLSFILLLGIFSVITTSCEEKNIEKRAENVLLAINIAGSDPVDSILRKVQNHFDLPGVTAAVIGQDEILWAGALGVINSQSTDPMTLDKCFDLNDVSKSFTSFIIMQLVEEGSVSLANTLLEIFPEMTDRIHQDYLKVTVGDVLRHLSGVSLQGGHIKESELPVLRGTLADKRIQISDWILKQASNGMVGKYNYSDAGYVLAAAIIERVTGNSYEREVRQRIYASLILYSGGFGWPVDFTLDNCYGHKREEGTVIPVRFKKEYLNLVEIPSGGIHMSTLDLSRFIYEHLIGLNGRSKLLSKKGFEILHGMDGKKAMGWNTSSFSGHPGTEAGGSGDGYRSEIFVTLDRSIGIAILININDDNDLLAAKTLELALLKKFGK